MDKKKVDDSLVMTITSVLCRVFDDLTTTDAKDKIEHSIMYLELLIDRLSSYDECDAYIRILKEHIEDYRHPDSVPRAIMD